jgi:hypothetical protein
MLINRLILSVFLCLPLLIGSGFAPAAAQTRSTEQLLAASRVILPIDDSVRVTVPHSTHPLATAANDVGPLDPNTPLERIVLVLGGSPDQEYQARTLLDSQQTKGSPNYHHWLTPEEYGMKFGPSTEDIRQVTNWLQGNGLSLGAVAKSGRWLEFAGTAAQVEAAFQTQMRQYIVNGERHVANATDISIPAALAPVVRGVLSLHNFYSQPTLVQAPGGQSLVPERGKPNVTLKDGSHELTPGDVAIIYGLNDLYSGTTPLGTITGVGETIAIAGRGNINLSDVAMFRSVFGLPANVPNVILNGGDPGTNVDSQEATLDVEYSGAVAQGATIDLVLTAETLPTDPIALSSAYIVDQNLAPVMSVSFGQCEQSTGTDDTKPNSFWNALWEQAAAQGISVFVSSGDTGAAGCDPNVNHSPNAAQGGLGVNGIGSTPYNTSVGGTEFDETVNGGTATTFWNTSNSSTYVSAIGYIPEMAWNDSCTPEMANSVCAGQDYYVLSAGSGGVSTVYAVPSYQTLAIQGLTGANFPMRALPDVALDGAFDHDSYAYCYTGPNKNGGNDPGCQLNGTELTPQFGGGTSFASPEFAGILALVDQATGGRQGLANYVLYALAAGESANFGSCNSTNQTNPLVAPTPVCVFNDVTVGNNGVPGNDTLAPPAFVPPGDTAGQEGYNAVTGYDPATGLGSVNVTTLVTDWAAATFEGSQTTFSASFNGTPLPSSSVSITHGQPVSVSVSVARQSASATGTPSGSISLIAQGGNLASPVGITSEPIGGTGGTATAGPVNVINLPGGTGYSLFATFPGDGVFAGSTSNAINVSVAPESSTTTLESFVWTLSTGHYVSNSSMATIDYGDPQILLVINANTAGVSGLMPSSGSVSFSVNGSALSPVPISDYGIAEMSDCSAVLSPCLALGTYTISASYSGDGLSYNGSSSTAPLTIMVTKGNVSPTVQGPTTSIVQGVAFMLSASLTPIAGAMAPTGTIQFLDGVTALGSPATLANGQASAQFTLNTTGTHSITAQYSGDSNYNSETSAAVSLTVAAAPGFSLTATTSSQTVNAGQTATYNLTLSATGGFAGQVTLSCTGAPMGANCAPMPNPATLSSTAASIPITVTVSTSSAGLVLPVDMPLVLGTPSAFHVMPFALLMMAALLLLVLRVLALRNGKQFGLPSAVQVFKTKHIVLILLAALVASGFTSCGQHVKTSSTLTITATSGSSSSSVNLNLTITSN